MVTNKFNLNMKKTLTAVTCGLVFNFSANAGVILDTNNDSFIDTTTGLEWMDFGINNGQSFNYVSSQLGAGGEYEGWRLPNVDEVFAMWWNVGDLNSYTPDHSFSTSRLHDGYFMARDLNNDANTESAFDPVFKIIGFNKEDPYGSGQNFTSYGFFEGTSSLSWLRYENYTLHSGVPDQLLYRDDQNINSERSTSHELYSTLLVKADSTPTFSEVPEPSSFAIFGLGFLALVSRKLNIYKSKGTQL